ncbi:elongation factor P-like protein YeiP [Echinimonas agarilytica]|uniref:Elongation factor P-like protein YeiP n=1 Tax=Echinimonas agarilytica TaxID=1215918 RepID=A0AA41W417_9GAMM|nr:elongation factor P-like protein YeiP [Echinimonas agarilytica]MCM2678436.1 elongation factor P-like protein YeiP [Echinimonas agarilytica]
MAKASEFKKGMVLEVNSVPHIVKTIEARNTSSRGAATLYEVRLNNLITQQKFDLLLKSDDQYPVLDCERAEVQYSYTDGDQYVFIRMDDYSQHPVNIEDISDELGYITEGLEGIVALIVGGVVAGLELPSSVILPIVDTSTSIKGSSSSARTKPAILCTGLEVQVPEDIALGDIIKINTATGQYMSRA